MQLIKKIQQIGFSRREAEVYFALLQKREFTAPELAKITTVTRTKIYEILQKLARKGLCNENYTNGQKLYRAVRPEIVFRRIISEYTSEIEQLKKATIEQQKKIALDLQRKEAIEQKKIKALEQKMLTTIEQKKMAAISIQKELSSLHENNLNNFEPIDYIEVLTDREQIKERWLNIEKNTKKELLVFTKPPSILPLVDNFEEETKILKNKIVIKGIYESKHITSDEEKKNFIEIIEAYQKLGEEAKIINELPMKLAISDETITMLALNDRISMQPSVTTMIIDHPSFAISLKRVFESYWVSSVSLGKFKMIY